MPQELPQAPIGECFFTGAVYGGMAPAYRRTGPRSCGQDGRKKTQNRVTTFVTTSAPNPSERIGKDQKEPEGQREAREPVRPAGRMRSRRNLRQTKEIEWRRRPDLNR